jgi:hypothetical protein
MLATSQFLGKDFEKIGVHGALKWLRAGQVMLL